LSAAGEAEGAAIAAFDGGERAAFWAEGEDDAGNDEQPASAGKTAKDVTIRTSRERPSHAASRASVTRLRNPGVPIVRLYQSLVVDLKAGAPATASLHGP